MSPQLKQFLLRWATTTVAVMVAANLGLGIKADSFTTLMVAALVLGILNAFLRPLLMLLALPLVILTLGFFVLVINALLLLLVGRLVSGFHVESFWPAFWGALVITVMTGILNAATGANKPRININVATPPRGPHREDKDGPVIDV